MPFDCHLKWFQSSTKPPIKFIFTNSNYTENPKWCADILNNFFWAQFCKDHLLEDTSIYTFGSSLYMYWCFSGWCYQATQWFKEWKIPSTRWDWERRPCFRPYHVDWMSFNIFKASLKNSKIPPKWKMAHVSSLYKRGAVEQPNNYELILLP